MLFFQNLEKITLKETVILHIKNPKLLESNPSLEKGIFF